MYCIGDYHRLHWPFDIAQEFFLVGEMHAYSGREWKPISSSSSCNIGQSTFIATSSTDHCVSKGIEEDEDELDLKSEEKDVAAPLPTNQTRQLKVKNTSAKDKRRLREKRRSTGVASLTGHKADEETTRNTLHNETAGVTSAAAAAGGMEVEHLQTSHVIQTTTGAEDHLTMQSRQPIPHHNGSTTQQLSKSADVISAQTSVQSIRIHDDAQVPPSKFIAAAAAAAEVTPNSHHITLTSSDFSKNLCARPFEAKRSILKSSNRPAAPAKPEVFVGASARSIQQGLSLKEEPRLLARVAELEKLLESERSENILMKKFLSEKDSRIRELELLIATLNEDLDLADEDYLRLEEENRALARALAELDATD